MRIALIGPGCIAIDENDNIAGHGAVERLLVDYKKELKLLGHEVLLLNTPNKIEIIVKANAFQADLIHCHYDVFIDLVPFLKCPKIIFSSHYPWIDQPEKHAQDGYDQLVPLLTNNHNFYLMTTSKKDHEAMLRYGANPDRMFTIPYGVSISDFTFNPEAQLDRSICLGKLEQRKRQHLLKGIEKIDFVGKNEGWVEVPETYLGEWSAEQKFAHLTDYSNLVLLSSGENSSSLVVLEAFAAGLGVVITEKMASELPDKPFISWIPENKVNDKDYLTRVIKDNRLGSSFMRNDIHKFAQQFSWKSRVAEYIKVVEALP